MAKGLRTFQAKSARRRARVHGFMVRIKLSPNILNNRRAKRRQRLTQV
jgi:ribosomal protein L34